MDYYYHCTGEVRQAKYGEAYLDHDRICTWLIFTPSVGEVPIYTRHEIKVPIRTNGLRIIPLDIENKINFSGWTPEIIIAFSPPKKKVKKTVWVGVHQQGRDIDYGVYETLLTKGARMDTDKYYPVEIEIEEA